MCVYLLVPLGLELWRPIQCLCLYIYWCIIRPTYNFCTCVCKPAFVQLYVFGITFFSYCTDCHLCCIWKLYTVLRWSLSLCSWSFFVCVSWFVAEYYSTNPNSTSPNMCTVAYSQLQPDVLVFVGIFQQFIYRLLYWTINSLLNCQHNNWFSAFKLLNV